MAWGPPEVTPVQVVVAKLQLLGSADEEQGGTATTQQKPIEWCVLVCFLLVGFCFYISCCVLHSGSLFQAVVPEIV